MMKQVLFLVILFLISCQKDIDFKLKSEFDSKIFIEGVLFPGEPPRIVVSSTLPFFSSMVTPQEVFISHASVELFDGEMNYQLVPDSIFDKLRCRWNLYYTADIRIQSGIEYTLRVEYENETYYGTTKTNQSIAEIEEVMYDPEFYDVYGGHDGVRVKVKDVPGQDNYYRFQMDRRIDNTRSHAHILEVLVNDCTSEGEIFPITDLGRSIYSDAGIDGKEIEMFVEVSFEYLEGDSATIYIQSLDSASASFFKDLDNQLQSIINPFVEPVFLHSNIKGAAGVFGSGVKSKPYLFVYPQDNP